MKRITFVVPDDINQLLEGERRRRNVPLAAVIREALATYLTQAEPSMRLPFIGLGHSGYSDTARRIDEVLAEEWGADRDR
jgi:hypothetical protein